MSQQQPLVVYSYNKNQFMMNIVTMMVAIIAAVTMSAFIVKAVVQGEMARAQEQSENGGSRYEGCSDPSVTQTSGDANVAPVQNVNGGSAGNGGAGGSGGGSGSGSGSKSAGKVVQNTTVNHSTNNSYVNDSYNTKNIDKSKHITDSFNFGSYNQDNDTYTMRNSFNNNTTNSNNNSNNTVNSNNDILSNNDVDVDVDVNSHNDVNYADIDHSLAVVVQD